MAPTTSAFSASVFQMGYKRNRAPVPESTYAQGTEVTTTLQELVRLEPGWDGYNAQPVSLENANFALKMLESICSDDTPSPQIVPGVNGDLQVEWHTSSVAIELHVVSPNNVYFWTSDTQVCPNDDELYLTTDFTLVLEPIKKLPEQASDRVATA